MSITLLACEMSAIESKGGFDGAQRAAERSYLPHVRGQRGGDERSYPESEVRGGGQEEVPHAPTPEARGGGREEQPHAQGQGQRPGGPTPCPRSHGCAGAGGPRGAIPR